MSIKNYIDRIERAKKESNGTPLAQQELVKLFTKHEQEQFLTPDEMAHLLSAIAGRKISTDYVKLLRRKERLPEAKKVNERAYIYKLRGAFAVTFRPNKKYPIK